MNHGENQINTPQNFNYNSQTYTHSKYASNPNNNYGNSHSHTKNNYTKPINNNKNYYNNHKKGNYNNYNNSNNNQKINELIISNEIYVLQKYPNLIKINNSKINLNEEIDDKSQFYVIKAFSEEDIHKGVKYGIWTSSKTGNQTLETSYLYAEESESSVYLLFSANKSGRFCGIAKIASKIHENKNFPFWSQDNKWTGVFKIEWLYIKDLPFKAVKDIEILMKDGEKKPVIFSRDVQEVPLEDGKEIMKRFLEFNHTNTLLEHFQVYDLRQENYANMNKISLEFNLD